MNKIRNIITRDNNKIHLMILDGINKYLLVLETKNDTYYCEINDQNILGLSIREINDYLNNDCNFEDFKLSHMNGVYRFIIMIQHKDRKYKQVRAHVFNKKTNNSMIVYSLNSPIDK